MALGIKADDTLTCHNLRKDMSFFCDKFCRNNQIDECLSHRFLGGVPKKALSSFVPVSDGAIECLSDNAICRAFNDGSQPCLLGKHLPPTMTADTHDTHQGRQKKSEKTTVKQDNFWRDLM